MFLLSTETSNTFQDLQYTGKLISKVHFTEMLQHYLKNKLKKNFFVVHYNNNNKPSCENFFMF